MTQNGLNHLKYGSRVGKNIEVRWGKILGPHELYTPLQSVFLPNTVSSQQHRWELINGKLGMMCYNGQFPHRLRTPRSRMTTNMLMTTSRKTMTQQVMPRMHLLTSQKTMVCGQKSLCQEDLRVEQRQTDQLSRLRQ